MQTHIISSNKDSGIIIEEEDVEMGNTSQSILEVAQREFGHLFSEESHAVENIFEQLRQAQFFPKQLEKKYKPIKDCLRLCYLTTIDQNNTKSPFTALDVAIFRISKEKAAYTESWFKKGIIPFLLFSTVTYISLLTVEENNYWKATIAATAGSVSTFALQLLSLCITGTNPNSSKNADNLKQNTIQKVKARYDEMAKELIVLNHSKPEFAKKLAHQIDLENVFNAALNSYLDAVEAKTLFKYLKDAVLFIRGKRAHLRHHELRLYVNNQI